jgi:hypothetical protein
MKNLTQITFLISGYFCLVLGILGAILPILPTTPFLLLSAFFFSKSSPKLHQWIINHKYFGPPLRNWEESGAISLKAKILSTVMILLVIIFRIFTLQLSLWIKITATFVLLCVLLFIWTRPSVKKMEVDL